jgi:hypothetical protein
MASPFPTEAESDELIVGPDSVAWRIGSDARCDGAGRRSPGARWERLH